MPNILDATGLTVKTYAELTTYYTVGYQSIYGADINLDSDSPDGQFLGITRQANLDNLDLLVQIYNSFDPDLAVGVVLDQRVAINGIQRQGGTSTITNVTLVVDRALSLVGLDALVLNPLAVIYTVADNAGNLYQLIASQSPSGAGTYVYAFQASTPGAILTIPNTITNAVTVILGVASVNNPTVATSTGINEETDAALKIRRQRSTALSSQGYLSGLLAALLNITGMVNAFVYENNTDSTDGDGVPSHSIWVITNGGASADIANAIYSKRNAGCGMKGSVTYTIIQLDMTSFVVRWDIVVPETLYIQFNAHSMNGIDVIDATYIKNNLVTLLVPGVNDPVNINELATLVQEIDSNCLVTGAGFSAAFGGPYTNTLSPTAKNKQFAVSAINIAITVI